VPKDWQLLARHHPPGWHLEFNPRLFSPDVSFRQATCGATGRALPDGTAIASDDGSRNAAAQNGETLLRCSGEATMWIAVVVGAFVLGGSIGMVVLALLTVAAREG
jgi:hypothetical protein